MTAQGIADCHLHVIDPGRFPFLPGVGYTPRPDETATRGALGAMLDSHGVTHALLVQPSCYGFDNSAMLDAIGTAAPGRFKAIAVISGRESEGELQALAERGVVGVRFNLVNADRSALLGAGALRLLERVKGFGWFAQIYAEDADWCDLAPVLRRVGVQVLVDHLGVRSLATGPAAPSFQAVLDLGRSRMAVVKLSAAFRIASRPDRYAELDGHVEALLAAFGRERCVWGSDWPFLATSGGIRYQDCLATLDHWLPDVADRDQVLRRNPARLFGFGR
jgi:predicted TIM-barrel fold metal-dependent hydrolase